MKKILFAIGVVTIIVLGIYAVSNIAQKSKNDSQKITIVATLFPLYDFVKNVGQDKVEVLLLLPPGIEAHSFEPKPSDIVRINEADLLVYTGKFMEPWAEDIINGISGKNVKVVDASSEIELMKEGEEHEEEHEEAEEHRHEHNGIDPHIWLDFDNAKIMVDNIAKAMAEKDAANADYYQKNATEYKNQLTKLDNEYETALFECKTKKIIYGGHYAFGYLAHRYGLEHIAAQGFSPDAEPTAPDLINLVEQIKKDNIGYVFYEELTSPKIAEIIAVETKAKMLLLNAAHNLAKEDFENNVSFLSIMENNLKNLSIGLQCNN
ncbi:zinc ABC transporter substrate-binding protein [Patescibacteria group bacterium]|nr:zinc ABC transporter substrate-binding protein [Patescibacteria group bacterium]MBU4579778.1 zinc ABC transporter substrate-binding protein [Patescibacteria group bacterium]